MKPPEPIPPWSADTSLRRCLEEWTAERRCQVVTFKVTQTELRTLVAGAALLGVRTGSLLAWAGTVNPNEDTLPRWRRPYITDNGLIRYIASLDVRALQVAAVLARRFGIDVETLLVARSFCWLRRIRSVRLDDPRWKRLEIPGARVPWTADSAEGGPTLE